MILTLNIPDDLGADLTAKLGEPSLAALEALAGRAYESGHFSLEQVRRLLGFPTRWEAQALLTRLGVWPGTTEADLASDLAALEKVFPLAG